MGVDFKKILQQAFEITKNHKTLWFFGLLLTGWSPMLGMFVSFYRFRIANVFLEPLTLMYISLGLLVFALFGLLAVNYGRLSIAVILGRVLKRLPGELEDSIGVGKYKRELVSFIYISGITSLLYALSAVVVGLPIYYLWDKGELTPHIVVLASAVLIGVGFVLSSLNIFASLFVVFYKRNSSLALVLAQDMVKSKWIEILILGGALLISYLVLFVCIQALSVIATGLLQVVFSSWLVTGFIGTGAMVLIAFVIKVIIAWIVTAIYSVFFNTAVTLLFFQLVADIENPEYSTKSVTQPVL